MTCDVCKQQLGDGLVVRWVSGVKHHLRCPETPAKILQREAALAKANTVRFSMAALKREVCGGELPVVDALDDPRAGRMSIFDLLKAQDGWGDRRVMRLLNDVELNPYRLVGDLTLRQKALIMDVLEPVEQAA